MSSIFKDIDKFIVAFQQKRNFFISTDTHSDWLVFEVRNLKWRRSDINFSIEIFPNFNDLEEIISWNINAQAWFDKRGSRYIKIKEILANVQFENIANNITSLLDEGFQYLDTVDKRDIPKVTDN